MTPEKSIHALYRRLLELGEILRNVRTTVVEDKPRYEDRALADHFGDGLDDMLGWLEQGLAALLEGREASAGEIGRSASWQALGCCHRHFNCLEQRYLELVSYRRLDSLVRLGQRESGEWQAWVETVRSGLGEAGPAMAQVRQDLLTCWQELASNPGGEPILVQNSVVSQQIRLPR